MGFILGFILEVVLWPFRTFPRTTLAILVLLAGGGTVMATALHGVAVNIFHEFNTVICGKPNCFSGIKIPGKH